MPSQKDNENQRNQQALHRCAVSGLEPCIGVIVGPYDQALPSEVPFPPPLFMMSVHCCDASLTNYQLVLCPESSDLVMPKV